VRPNEGAGCGGPRHADPILGKPTEGEAWRWQAARAARPEQREGCALVMHTKIGRPGGMPTGSTAQREVERSRTGRGTAQPPAPACEQYLEARTRRVRSASLASRRRCYPQGSSQGVATLTPECERRAESELGKFVQLFNIRCEIFREFIDTI
jgi:hypothetical protein